MTFLNFYFFKLRFLKECFTGERYIAIFNIVYGVKYIILQIFFVITIFINNSSMWSDKYVFSFPLFKSDDG